jgi:hypothetical protein
MRVASAEWRQRARAAEARKRERDAGRVALAQLKGERERSGGEPTDRERNLSRHIAMLVKEILADSKDREAVEASVGRCLVDALGQLAAVLCVLRPRACLALPCLF